MSITIQTLLACLKSPDPNVRVRAVAFLAKSKDARAVPYLERVASEDDSPRIRYYARKGIAHVLSAAGVVTEGRRDGGGDASQVTALAPGHMKEKLNSADQWDRLQAIRAAERFTAREYIPLLIERLGIEENRQVLSALLLALGKVGGYETAQSILPFLEHDDARVRANAIEAVDAVGDEGLLIHLIPYLRDTDNRCRANAVLALRKCGRVNVFKTLEGMLQSREVWMQDSATFVLGRMGSGARVFELLNFALESDFLVVRQQARGVLERLAERGIDRARSLLERLGEHEVGNPEEQLFDRLERLSSSSDENDSSEAVSSRRLREGPPGKNPEEALAALATLGSSAARSAAGEEQPATSRLQQRSEAAYLALKALVVDAVAEDEDSSQSSGRGVSEERNVTQLSGAFQVVDEEGEE